MRASLPTLAGVFLAAVFVGCDTPHHLTLSEPPVIVIHQLPDYPAPGRDSEFPGGLVAALWRDGHMIRSTDPNAVGRSYVEGVVASQQRDEFFAFLDTTAIIRAAKVERIPLHVATQSITIRSDGTMSRWTRILPDTESVWREVEGHLFRLPLQSAHAIDSETVQSLK